MSHLYYKTKKTRLQRSELAVPGSSPQMFEKALNSNADYVFLDLEDAVSPNDKVSARENVISALSNLNWNEKCMESHKYIHDMSTGTNSANIHQPIYKTSMQYWKRYEKQLQPLLEILKT